MGPKFIQKLVTVTLSCNIQAPPHELSSVIYDDKNFSFHQLMFIIYLSKDDFLATPWPVLYSCNLKRNT